MAKRCGTWMAAALLASGALLGARPAEAYLIATSPPAAVLPHASHVVRVTLPATAEGFTVEKVYRGTLEPGPLTVHGMSDFVGVLLHSNKIPESHAGTKAGKAVALILALYRMDGRYYVVGRHPAHGVSAHSSIWVISEKGVAHRYHQVFNPGWPVPVPVQHEDFAGHFEDLLLAHPFEGFRHRPLPEVERERFLALVEPTIDWYGQRLADYETKAAPRLELARQLSTYAKTAPESMALPVFETLVLLSDMNYAAQKHQPEVGRLMLAHMKQHGVATFAETILTALDRQPYGTGDRGVLLGVLKETDAQLYRKGVAVLRALCLRQPHNEAVDAWHALKRHGETAIVAEIDKAWAALEAEHAAARGLPPPEPATEPESETTSEKQATRADAEAAPRLTPRIQTGEPAPPAEPESASPEPAAAQDVSLLILVAGLALAGALAGLLLRRNPYALWKK